MRRIFTVAEAYARGMTPSSLRWAVGNGSLVRVAKGAYAEGPEPPAPIERELGRLLGVGGVANGTLAGELHGLDSVRYRPSPRNRVRHYAHVVLLSSHQCTDGLDTMLDLAALLDDTHWEHALESALRKKLVTVAELERALTTRRVGNARIRRVLKLRPKNAPATESLLETLMVQLIRSDPRLPGPERQVEVYNRNARFVARVDLAWPEPGVFIELDGQHHADQPVYDASRETAVVATTGWLPGPFTWTEVTKHPKSTARRLVALLAATSL